MTVAIVNDKNLFKFRALSDVLPKIRLILGNFVENLRTNH